MANDIYSRNLTYDGQVRPEDIYFTSSKNSIASGLVTGLQLQYQQQLTRMWSLFGNSNGGANLYLIAGDTQGELSVSAIYGPGNVSSGGASYNMCEPGAVSLSVKGKVCGGQAVTRGGEQYTCRQAVVTNIGFSGNNGGMSITKNIGISFLSMSGRAS